MVNVHQRITKEVNRRYVLMGMKRPVGVPMQVYRRQQQEMNRDISSLKSLKNNGIVYDLKFKKFPNAFNPSVINFGEKYICAFRSQEFKCTACILDKNFIVDETSFFTFNLDPCVDSRLLWALNGDLLAFYASPVPDMYKEHIRASVIMKKDSGKFSNNEHFRVSPQNDPRHKNWCPFISNGKMYITDTVKPHKVYEVEFGKAVANPIISNWTSKWYKPLLEKRGSTNAVNLGNGMCLGTFHTIDGKYYDNGLYLFEDKPPFKVLQCSSQPFLKAEDSTPCTRWQYTICAFPMSMIKKGENIIISYGENDNACKIFKIALSDMLDILQPVNDI